jgi:hypothetical protein
MVVMVVDVGCRPLAAQVPFGPKGLRTARHGGVSPPPGATFLCASHKNIAHRPDQVTVVPGGRIR